MPFIYVDVHLKTILDVHLFYFIKGVPEVGVSEEGVCCKIDFLKFKDLKFMKLS